jgi:hypothetical protein
MDLKEKLCLRFCPYYKPSKDKALVCRGFVEVERLAGKGGHISFENRSRTVCPETAKALVLKMCAACQFFREDCDFVQKGEEASPCGGFLLLGQLVDDGMLSIDDLGEMD